MELLTKAWTRGAALVQSLSPTARVVAGLSLAAVVVGLVYLNTGPPGGDHEYLLGGRALSDQEIDRVQVAFSQAGLSDWQIESNRVRIPRVDRHAYIAALADKQAMPETFGSAWERMLDSNSLFESSSVRQLRQRHAMERELSLVVSRMAGIEEATVTYDEVELGGFPVRKRTTAMVAARGGGQRNLDVEQVRSVRDLIAGAIAGLESNDVTVTDLGKGRTYRGGAAPSDAELGETYIAIKKTLEDSWRDRIAEMLSVYPGIVVAVNAELNPTDARDQDAGPPPLAVSVAATPYQRSRITASVAVPRSYFLQVWRQRSQMTGQWTESRPTREMLREVETDIHATIQRQVLAVLPLGLSGPPASDSHASGHPASGHPASPQVVVSTYDDLPPAEPNDLALLPSTMVGREWFARYWPALAIGAMVLAALWALRMVLRTSRTTLPPRRDVEADTMPMESVAKSSDQSLQDELAAIVHRDPDTAAGILRDWIGEAA